MIPDTESDPRVRDILLGWQKNEATENRIYLALAGRTSEAANRKVLEETAAVELGHYRFFRSITGTDPAPSRVRIAFYLLVHRVFGITFALKLMEKGERKAQRVYREQVSGVPGLEAVIADEEGHERALLGLIDERRLKYTGSIVLGLNDALVELTGTLAGLTLAFQNTRVIAMAGLITGIASALSMGSAEYLSTKSEGEARNPLQAATYTFIAYIVTVLLLVFPFLALGNYYLALAATIAVAILIIIVFSFYISVTRDQDFRGRFLEMAALSLGIAALSFLLGILVRIFLGVNS